MLKLVNLYKVYKTKEGLEHVALKGINLTINSPDFVVVLGKSGSGKTTLMNLLGGLDQCDEGEIIICGKSSKDFKSSDWDSYRNTYCGFVFQEFHIINEFSIYKNISLVLELQGYSKSKIKDKVYDVLKSVDLDGYANRYPNELSGGQKQRIALARALIKNPDIILADEPTGNLDSDSGHNIVKILKKISKDKLVIMVTHDRDFAHHYADRIIELKDGEIILDDYIYDKQKNYSMVDANSQKIIKLKSTNALNSMDIFQINEIIKDSTEQYYILLIKDESIVKSIFPKFLYNDTVNHSKLNNTQNYDNKINLVNVDETIDNTTLKLIKSNLTFNNSLKIAVHSLTKKKFRLILMLFLFICSVTFFGIAINFNRYDVDRASIITFKKQGISNMNIYKYYETCYDTFCFDTKDYVKKGDLNNLRMQYPNLQFYPTMGIDIDLNIDYDIPVENNHNYLPFIRNVTFIDNQFQDKLIGKNSTYPLNEGDILITDYTAEVLLYYKAFPDAANINDLVDQELIIEENISYKITGILDTEFSKETLEDGSFYTPMIDNFSTIFTLEENLNSFVEMNNPSEIRLFISKEGFSISGSSIGNIVVSNQSSYPTDKLKIIGEYPVEEDEILVSTDYLEFTLRTFGTSDNDIMDNLNDMIGKEIIVDYYKYKVDTGSSIDKVDGKISKKYKITGIFNSNENNTNVDIIVSDNKFISLREEAITIVSIYVVFSKNEKDNYKFISELSNIGYKHDTSYSDHIYSLKQMSTDMEQILLIIASAFGVFSAVMILTFISMSINLKRKEIGILRAIGSRGIDIAKIFITESLIIGLIAATLSTILVKISIVHLDNSIQYIVNNKFTILYLDYVSVFYVFILAIGMSILSSSIPIIKIAKEQPIDAIRLK